MLRPPAFAEASAGKPLARIEQERGALALKSADTRNRSNPIAPTASAVTRTPETVRTQSLQRRQPLGQKHQFPFLDGPRPAQKKSEGRLRDPRGKLPSPKRGDPSIVLRLGERPPIRTTYHRSPPLVAEPCIPKPFAEGPQDSRSRSLPPTSPVVHGPEAA